MLIEFTTNWRRHRAGDVTEWPDGAANVLIRRGKARAHAPAATTAPSKHVLRHKKQMAMANGD